MNYMMHTSGILTVVQNCTAPSLKILYVSSSDKNIKLLQYPGTNINYCVTDVTVLQKVTYCH